jgi:glyoxalase family protein
MPDRPLPGVHHITALSGAAQETHDFYTGVLGLRLVKKTVNFDDPMTHHLYYGDTVGRPGTLLTVFPWPKARRGRTGAGMVQIVSFAVPPRSLDAWAARLADTDLSRTRTERFGTPALQFEDPSGMNVELAAVDTPNDTAWTDGPAPEGAALQGLHAPVLPIFPDDRTPSLFTEVFGWEHVGTDGDYLRLQAPDSSLAAQVDLLRRDRHPSGRMGQGAVHHIAFRARSADEQRQWQAALRDRGLQVTDVKDRRYFQSIYFRDPDWTSGTLFEIATDGPGFLTDEDETALGEALQLPPWLSGRRNAIEGALPSLAPPPRPDGTES